LLKGDPYSYFNQNPGWTPSQDPLLSEIKDEEGRLLNQDREDGAWTLASIIRLSGLPVDGDDVTRLANGA
jgi:hypothetical protein